MTEQRKRILKLIEDLPDSALDELEAFILEGKIDFDEPIPNKPIRTIGATLTICNEISPFSYTLVLPSGRYPVNNDDD